MVVRATNRQGIPNRKAGGSFFRESRRAYDEPPDDGADPR